MAPNWQGSRPIREDSRTTTHLVFQVNRSPSSKISHQVSQDVHKHGSRVSLPGPNSGDTQYMELDYEEMLLVDVATDQAGHTEAAAS